MSQLFASGHVIDLVLVMLALEVWLLRAVFKRAHVLPWPTLLAALGLLLAWRLAQGGASWFWIALPLTAAGLAHGWDLWQRWPRPPAR